jgi:threonine dehydratase
LARTLIDEILLASEAEIRQAVFSLLNQAQLLVEASGAIAIAPLLKNPQSFADKTVVCVLTGANIDSNIVVNIINEQLGAQ